MEENYKVKPLTKYQIKISLDRLTRFKSTEDKYLRVFKDILTTNLLYPKFKKKQLEELDYQTLSDIISDIFNFSICEILKIKKNSNNLKINKKLLTYEKSVFQINKNIELLLKNKIDFDNAVDIIEEDKNLPLNLQWLISLKNEDDQVITREKYGTRFPIEKIILVEGITEEILLPKFVKLLNYDLDKSGIQIISAGGKNQVVKLFYQYAEILKIPMYVLLDKDALENFKEIKPKLRKKDIVHVLMSGEFEDLLPLNLIKRTLNKQFEDFAKVKIEDLRQDAPMTKILTEIYKDRGSEFKKAEFAHLVSENITNKNDISMEIETVISELLNKC